jgi:16S rRNA (guanine1207-N2)-methyltransferase
LPRRFEQQLTKKFIPESELALIEAALEREGNRVWTTTSGRAQLALALARERFDGHVTCLVMDAFQAEQIRATPGFPTGLDILCSPDWPDGECDLALFPLDPHGQKELARDLIQSAFQKLRLGGSLMIALPSKAEAWGREQLKPLSKSIKVEKQKGWIVCSIVKNAELKRARNFHATFAFRDHGELIHLTTRPGVFSHRKLDLGARQLLNHCDPAPGIRGLDLGCGAGAVVIALAHRDPTSSWYAIDSHARAIQCTQDNAIANGLTNVQTFLNHDEHFELPEKVDLVVANPPYFSNNRITEIFCINAFRNLKPGGQACFVTKQTHWYTENFDRWFDEIVITPSSSYQIVSGVKRIGKEKSRPTSSQQFT